MQAIKLRLYQEYILRINQEFMQGDDDEGDGYCQQEYDGDGVEGGQGFGQLKGWNDKDKKSKKDKQQD